MSKTICIVLLIFSSTVSQTKITAKYNKDIVDSIAQTYASDVVLGLVTTSDVDTSGFSSQWQYVYVSVSEYKEYIFSVFSDSIKHQETNQMRDGLGVIEIEWVDSDSAFKVINNNGGRNILLQHPSCTIEASLVRYVIPHFDTYWRVDFKTNDSIFTLHLNAETGEIPTSIMEEEKIIDNFTVYQNYPNPFNPTTIIRYRIPEAGLVTLKVYDVLGREKATLVNEEKLSGSYEVEFDGSNLSSGVYFYRMREGDFIETKKFVLIK